MKQIISKKLVDTDRICWSRFYFDNGWGTYRWESFDASAYNVIGWLRKYESKITKSILKNRGSIFAKSQRSLIKYNWILRNQDGLTHLRGRICRSWHFRQGFQHSDERFPQQASWSQIYHADESRNPAGFLRIQFCSGSDFLSFGEIDLE